MVTLEQVQSRITKLQKQAEELLRKKNASVIADIKALLAKNGLTTADIDAYAGPAKRGPKPGAKRAVKTAGAAAAKEAAPQVKGKLPPKYRNPKTGETWSGHARPPVWIANVKDRSKFLIGSVADAALAASAGSASKAKSAVKKATKPVGATAGKGQRKGPQPALYRDPKTGATWSGRGRAPAWFAGAKNLSKFLIDGAGAVANEVSTFGTADKLKAAGKSDAAAKKAATKKVVAKKAASTKSPTVKKVTPTSKKVAAPSAKRAVVKKVAGKKAVVVKTVTAKVDTTATPEASVEVGA